MFVTGGTEENEREGDGESASGYARVILREEGKGIRETGKGKTRRDSFILKILKIYEFLCSNKNKI